MLLALKMEEGTISQGISRKVALETEKEKEMNALLEPPHTQEGVWP